jgi:hypothetical protein
MSKDAEQDGQVGPEVTEKAVRRRFTAEYKERILDEAEFCAERIRQAETIIDVQKKVCEMLGIAEIV